MDALHSNNDRPARKRRPSRRFYPESKTSSSTGKKRANKSSLIKKSKVLQESSGKRTKRKKSELVQSSDNKRQHFRNVVTPKKGRNFNARTLKPMEYVTKKTVGSIKSNQSKGKFIFGNRGLVQVVQTHRGGYKHRKRTLQSRICVPLSFGVSQPLYFSSEQSIQKTMQDSRLISVTRANDSIQSNNEDDSSRPFPETIASSNSSSHPLQVNNFSPEIFRDAPDLIYQEFQELMHEDYDLLGIPLPSLSDISTIESFDTDDNSHPPVNENPTLSQASAKQEDPQQHDNIPFDEMLQFAPSKPQNLQNLFLENEAYSIISI